jgi:hypothetical protein
VLADQTRGPSKQGTIGFPLGGSQPYFPLDDEVDPPRRLKVLEVNLLTQDLVVVCPEAYGRQLLDSALRHHGVAHFLFHPAHIEKPGVADALCSLVDYGRQQGLEWWTSEQIYRWEMLRRGVTATFDDERENALTLSTPDTVANALLLFPRPNDPSHVVTVDEQSIEVTSITWHGFPCDSVQLDLVDGCCVRGGDEMPINDSPGE